VILCVLVALKRRPFGESPPALAHMRPHATVDVKVISQVAWRWKGSRTESALVRFFLIVNHSMVVEIGARRELLSTPAECAFERFLTCVDSEREK
jgi:hypothetical protein